MDYARGYLGRLDPETAEVAEWANPSGEGARPYGVAIDEHDRVWFVETGVRPNRFVGFDTRREEYISEVDVASGGGTIRHMYFDPKTSTIWFGTDVNTVGRAVLPPLRRSASRGDPDHFDAYRPGRIHATAVEQSTTGALTGGPRRAARGFQLR